MTGAMGFDTLGGAARLAVAFCALLISNIEAAFRPAGDMEGGGFFLFSRKTVCTQIRCLCNCTYDRTSAGGVSISWIPASELFRY